MGLFDKIKGLLTADKSESQSGKTKFSELTEMNYNSETNNETEEDSLSDKAKDFVAGTLDEVKDQGSHLWDQLKEKASALNEATKEYREKLADKANDALEKIDDFVDSTFEKAKKLEEEEKLKDSKQDGFADKPIDFGKPLSETKSDFFTKAEEWLEKNESSDNHHLSNADDASKANHNKIINPLELPKDPE